MKKLFTLAVIIAINISAIAQVPHKMSYQCVLRNASGALVTNQSIGVKISILQDTPDGTVVYQELFTPNPETNANGLLSIEIGTGLTITGNFASIVWADGPYFLKTEIDPIGTTNYTIEGLSQLLSVPYAFYSEIAGEPADNSVTSAKIADGTIVTADLADGSVTAAKIAEETIVTEVLADGSVTSAKMSGSGANANNVLQYTGSSVVWNYAPGSIISYTFLDANCNSAPVFSGTYTKIANIGTVLKTDSDSRLEVSYYGRVYIEDVTTTGAYFEMRVNDLPTTNGRANIHVKRNEIGPYGVPAFFTAVFSGMSAGYHSVSMWVRAQGTGTGKYGGYNAGCWSGDYVIVREIK